MKKRNIITRVVMSSVITLLAFTSCQDWLTLYPQTQIVEENFWEDKNDLDGVRYAIYKNMCSTLEKMVLWGDLRSDSYVLLGADESTTTKYLYDEIREGKIDRDSAESYFDWAGFYTTINYCNKVLSHGAEILEKDKQFTPTEWKQMKAEVTTLRALNYFYLIRSFKDVPYTTKVINNDTEVEYFGATNQLVILDSLIADVENIQGQGINRYTTTADTKGMITNAAIYALLSDMYLWRASLHEGRWGKAATDTVTINNIAGQEPTTVPHSVADDYQKCIDYADLAIGKLYDQNDVNNRTVGVSKTTTINFGLDKCDLIKNDFDDFASGGSPELTAFEKIFTQGNSQESIFELQFNSTDSRSNSVVNSQWGYGTAVHLAASSNAIDAILGTMKNHDARTWYSCWNNASSVNGTSYSYALTDYCCFKWYKVSFGSSSSGDKGYTKYIDLTSASSESYRNWIIYRLSDVMLQKAEALAALGKTSTKNEALQIVNALNRRWYCPDKEAPTAVNEDVTTSTDTIGNLSKNGYSGDIEVAVMNERQIEFMGEGKRWFDLVRYAERHAGGTSGSGDDVRESTESHHVNSGLDGVTAMVDKFMKNTFSQTQCTSLKNHFKNRYGLYNIIYYMEIKASKDDNGVQHLEQNPVWNKSQYDQ